jgi:hypothetical protein
MRETRIEKEVEIYATNLANNIVHEHQCIEKYYILVRISKIWSMGEWMYRSTFS